jgi:hypothetical protein
MKTIEDYFTYVRQLMQRVPDASAERYEEQLLSVHRGNLRIRLRFSNHALLEISEAVVIIAEELRWLSYRYHYQDQLPVWFSGMIILRIIQRSPHTHITSMRESMFWPALALLLSRYCTKHRPFEAESEVKEDER